MHAMHVDAFFEYCLGKTHNYYTQIPSAQDLNPETGRDGVPLEEDLALRALHPESRPKRGRRKTEDKDLESDRAGVAVKRPHLDTSVAVIGVPSFAEPQAGTLPQNAITPSTAPTDGVDRYNDHLDSWTAMSTVTAHAHSAYPASGTSGGQQFRWRLNTRDSNTPLTPHPRSAVTPSTGQPPDSGFDEPMSAMTPSTPNSKGRARRRHGPAVSSAWPSGGNPLTGKLRGRPPSNRSVRDGPFSTFPANPKTREGPLIDLQGSTPVSTPILGSQENPSPFHQSPYPGALAQGKPGTLHLHVPEHTGGVVRLATPTVMLNGALERAFTPSGDGHAIERTHSSTFSDGDQSVDIGSQSEKASPGPYTQLLKSGYRLDTLVQFLTAKLCNAKHEKNQPITIDTILARRLALQAIARLHQSQNPSTSEIEFLVVCANWFGLTNELGLPSAVPGVMKDLTVHVLPSSGGPAIVGSHIQNDSNARTNTSGDINAVGTVNQKISYALVWRVETIGGMTAECRLHINLGKEEQSPAAQDNVTAPAVGQAKRSDNEEAAEWKRKYFALQHQRDDEMARTRKKILEAVL